MLGTNYYNNLALEIGSLLIDNGWLRILGAGNQKMFGSLIFWNKPIEDPLIIAYNLIGGF